MCHYLISINRRFVAVAPRFVEWSSLPSRARWLLITPLWDRGHRKSDASFHLTTEIDTESHNALALNLQWQKEDP
jgi:hypothetical protein